MPRLVGVRKQLDWTVYDTALKADGPCALEKRVTIYGNKNVGEPNLSNMLRAAQFPADETFMILSTPTLVSFENEKLYGVVARDVKVCLEVGNSYERGGPQPLPLGMVRGDRPSEFGCSTREEFDKLCESMHHVAMSTDKRDIWAAVAMVLPGGLMKPIMVPPRQCFVANMEFFNGSEAILAESSGAKSIVHCLRGIMTMDLY